MPMKPIRNPWPLAIVLTFALFISGTVGLVVMACSQRSDLVSNDYYDQEVRYQNHIEQVRRTHQLPAPGTIRYDQQAQRILVGLPPEQVRSPVRGWIKLYRPSAAGLDRQFELHPGTDGLQRLDASALVPGLWKVRVCWTSGGEDYFMDQPIKLTRRL